MAKWHPPTPAEREAERKRRAEEQKARDERALAHAAENPVDPAERARLRKILGAL